MNGVIACSLTQELMTHCHHQIMRAIKAQQLNDAADEMGMVFVMGNQFTNKRHGGGNRIPMKQQANEGENLLFLSGEGMRLF